MLRSWVSFLTAREDICVCRKVGIWPLKLRFLSNFTFWEGYFDHLYNQCFIELLNDISGLFTRFFGIIFGLRMSVLYLFLVWKVYRWPWKLKFRLKCWFFDKVIFNHFKFTKPAFMCFSEAFCGCLEGFWHRFWILKTPLELKL